jgi:diguanylate cyclase (GGDEF)-like protein
VPRRYVGRIAQGLRGWGITTCWKPSNDRDEPARRPPAPRSAVVHGLVGAVASLVGLMAGAMMIGHAATVPVMVVAGATVMLMIACATVVHAVIRRIAAVDAGENRQGIGDTSGLLTASAWQRQAAHALAEVRQRDKSASLLMIDLDNLRLINARYGREAGDTVLGTVARLVHDDADRTGVAGRLDADNFALLLPEADAAAAADRAERIRRRVQDLHVTLPTRRGPTTVSGFSVSIGAATCPNDGTTLDELTVSADILLFAAKEGGRNQTRLARPRYRNRAA